MIVLDTNVISALMDLDRNEVIAAWLDRQPATSIWTTSISILEVGFGIERLAQGHRRNALATAFARVVRVGLGSRVLGFGEAEATETAALMARRRAAGRLASANDDMIAGIVRVHRGTLATRNIKHFEDAGIALVDPWGANPHPQSGGGGPP